MLFLGQGLTLHVFEERYLQLMEDVLPEGPFTIVAIRVGREVGGPYEPYGVGVRVVPDDFDLQEDGIYRIPATRSAFAGSRRCSGWRPGSCWR